MADEEKKGRRDSASSHSSVEEVDEKKSNSSEGDHDSDKHSTFSEHEDEHSTTEHDGHDTDKHSTSSEHVTDKHSSTSSGEDDPENPKDESPRNSRKSSHHSSASSSRSDKHPTDDDHPHTTDDNHSHITDDNHSHSTDRNPPMPLYQNVNHEGLLQDDPKDGSIDSFGINHVYANAAFEPEPQPDYQATSGAESPSIHRTSVATYTDYERPNPPPSDLDFYTIPLHGTESDRPPSSSTVVVIPDGESEWPWLTYLYGAIVFSIIFIIILIIYFAVSFTQ